MFNNLDEDKNGNIDVDEFVSGNEKSGYLPTVSKSKSIIFKIIYMTKKHYNTIQSDII